MNVDRMETFNDVPIPERTMLRCMEVIRSSRGRNIHPDTTRARISSYVPLKLRAAVTAQCILEELM